MKTSMTNTIRFWALALAGLLLSLFSSVALADSCKFEKNIDLTLDLTDSNTLSVLAAAGELDITGVSGTDLAVINGRVCASKEAWLEESRVNTEGCSNERIEVELPSGNKVWSWSGNNYVRMDLSVEVPDSMALEVMDSSGGMFLKNIASVEVKDCSGDIQIENAKGPVSISDSSGDIDVDRAEGDLTIESDSSGGIYANDIRGSVLVVKDSSGDIKVTDISHDVIVERDSSGDIKATHGPDTIGVLTSARVTNEENYIANKFTRAVLKTNNIDHCARL